MKDEQEFFERRIITGMITSTDYLDRILPFWDSSLLQSSELRIVSNWVMAYYEKYKKAPKQDIEAIFIEQLQKSSIQQSQAKYIEFLLSSLSEEFEEQIQFNSAYLYDRTIEYLKTQEITQHNEEVQSLIELGKVKEAEELAQGFVSKIVQQSGLGLDLSSREALKSVERSFNTTQQEIIHYPGNLGNMLNQHLIRGGFVSFLAPEKRGKTFWLLEVALRAIRQKNNVAFFEAGDMTESQILKRICIYIAKKSDRQRYCQERFSPIGDCILNQLNLCKRKDRNCDHGIFENFTLNEFLKNKDQILTIENLTEKFNQFPDYCPCDSFNCDKRKGSVWIQKIPEKLPLNAKTAKKVVRRFFKRYKRRFKLICEPAGSLTVSSIKKYLNEWEKHDGFVPDIIVVDYADLLSAADSAINEFRHRQDHIWKSLRALSQEKHALVLTATQADATSYRQGRLSISNFSEDKRKYAHVTAQYGLNQDPAGREKKLGIMRLNEIVVREGDFSSDREVHVLYDFSMGRAFLESF